MKAIKLNDTVKLDLDKLIAGKLLLQAGSGGGKSYAIRRILEQSFGEIPHLILDTEGEFSSLREKYDYILIGKGLDISADPKTAALLAVRLWEERVSAIIDLYELSPWDRQLFVRNFVDALINAPKKLWNPVLLVIDEAHEYAPESDKSDSGKSLHLLASKGRKRKIGAIFATQRISTLSKNIVASCKNKLIGYASETNDVKRAAFELGFSPNEGRSLRDLDPGEFYAFGPALTKEVTKIKIGPVKTSHEQSNTGGLGHVAPASAKIKAALAKLADLPQAAAEEARTVAELKSQIVQLKRIANTASTPYTDEAKIIEEVKRAVTTEKERSQEVQKKFKDMLYQKLLKSHGSVFRALDALSKDIDGLKQEETAWFIPDAAKRGLKMVEIPKPHVIAKEAQEWVGSIGSDAPAPYVPTKEEKKNFLEYVRHGFEEVKLAQGERQVLIAIAQQPEGMTREHITVQTGYKRSTRDAYIQRLVQKGYVEIFADGKIQARDAGIEALGNNYEPLPTGRELLEYHLRKLPAGESRVLNTLVEAGRSLSRDDLTTMTSFKRSTRDAYIQRLATRQLVVIEGQTIRINEHLV